MWILSHKHIEKFRSSVTVQRIFQIKINQYVDHTYLYMYVYSATVWTVKQKIVTKSTLLIITSHFETQNRVYRCWYCRWRHQFGFIHWFIVYFIGSKSAIQRLLFSVTGKKINIKVPELWKLVYLIQFSIWFIEVI